MCRKTRHSSLISRRAPEILGQWSEGNRDTLFGVAENLTNNSCVASRPALRVKALASDEVVSIPNWCASDSNASRRARPVEELLGPATWAIR